MSDGKEIELKKGHTSAYYVAAVVKFVDDGNVTLDGESCRIVDEAGSHLDTLALAKKDMSVEGGSKGYLVRGKVSLA